MKQALAAVTRFMPGYRSRRAKAPLELSGQPAGGGRGTRLPSPRRGTGSLTRSRPHGAMQSEHQFAAVSAGAVRGGSCAIVLTFADCAELRRFAPRGAVASSNPRYLGGTGPPAWHTG
jgi:hypothetical protein